MNKESIEKKVKVLLSHSEQGLEIESPKIDFKSKWYDLTSKPSISEFIKDTTAIANTVGTDGFIIIGFNDETKNYEDATFKDCGLKDSSDIPNLIIKNCSNLFDLTTYDFIIDSHRISVIHIPPTLEKPIVILDHKTYKKGTQDIKHRIQHRIFIRKNTSTFPASKNDLELMYYDRKNIEPDYLYTIEFLKTEYYFNSSIKYPLGARTRADLRTKEFSNYINLTLSIENFGKRTMGITKFHVSLERNKETSLYEEYTFYLNGIQLQSSSIKASIQANEIIELNSFFYKETNENEIKVNEYEKMKIDILLTNDKKISKEIDLSDFPIQKVDKS